MNPWRVRWSLCRRGTEQQWVLGALLARDRSWVSASVFLPARPLSFGFGHGLEKLLDAVGAEDVDGSMHQGDEFIAGLRDQIGGWYEEVANNWFPKHPRQGSNLGPPV